MTSKTLAPAPALKKLNASVVGVAVEDFTSYIVMLSLIEEIHDADTYEEECQVEVSKWCPREEKLNRIV